MKKYDILRSYIYCERCRLEADITQLQNNIRYRRISSVDCLELIIAQERLNAFNDFSAHVISVLRLNENK